MLLGLGLGVMRGERERPPLRVAYWLVVAIYMIATLGQAMAAGNELAVATAICFPAGPVMFPCLLAEGLSVATETIADQVWEGEHSEDSIAASVDSWTAGFMQDFRQQHSVDRRSSNGGGHTKEKRHWGGRYATGRAANTSGKHLGGGMLNWIRWENSSMHMRLSFDPS